MVANGIVISLLIYLIQLWGGSSEYLISFLQVLQNKAARIVTNLGWRTSVKTLLDQCGWMSVKQLSVYHTLLLTFKIKQERKPVYLDKKLSQDFNYKTRFAEGHAIRVNYNIKHDCMEKSFIPRSVKTWNTLPAEIKGSENINIFKQQLKIWVKKNIPIT